MTSFFRYPGGKTKLRKEIINCLNGVTRGRDIEYREPFFGGGSIGLNYLPDAVKRRRVWINDKDKGIACLWTSVLCKPKLLQQLVKRFVPSISAFETYKFELLDDHPIPDDMSEVVEYGFKKLAIHQLSYSGLGTKSGGPLGGQSQSSPYKIDCRWSPDYICKKIDKLHQFFSQFEFRHNRCTCDDFESLIEDTQYPGILYLDPPYYIKGNQLYQCGFTESDHQRLMGALKATKHAWVLSYDDVPEIRELYSWANIREISEVNYSITVMKDGRSRTKPELMIYGNQIA